MMRRPLAIFALLGSAAIIVPASAQDVPAPSSETASTDDSAQSADAQDDGEIVVTAQRRDERLRDVPISVTALTPEGLSAAGISNTRELTLVTPGLRVEAVGAYLQPAIRGITTTLTGVSADANVATYVDGVYQQTTLGSVFELPDVRQVQVLKGPQGTLFGRNATGGAILVTTLDPDLSVITGKLSASYGSFGSYSGAGYVSAPLVKDRIAVSLTGYFNHEGAFRHDLLRGGERRGVIDSTVIRGKIRVQPWEGADFILSGSYSQRDDGQSLSSSYINGNNASNRNPALPAVVIPREPNTFANDVDSYSNSKVYSVSLKGDIEVGPGTLTTITSYTDHDSYIVLDSDASARPVNVTQIDSFSRVKTQELIYSADPIGIVQPIIGGFLYAQDSGVEPQSTLTFATGSRFSIYTLDEVRAQALFGEINWQLAEPLKLITGVRYSHERRTAHVARLSNPTSVPTLPLLGTRDFESVTPRLSLVYTASPQANFYATYSKGFKSGAFQTTAGQVAPVNPEQVSAYEAGVKARFGSAFNFNLAGFHYDYTDLQVSSIQTQPNGTFLSVLQNAATARINGLELDGAWRPVGGLQFSFGASWLDAKYVSFPAASVNVPQPDGLGGNVTVPRDASGKQMIRAPKFTSNLTAMYAFDLGGGRVQASGTIYYSSRIYYDAINRVSQSPYATINAKLGWQPREGLELSVYARNLTNKAVIAATTLQSLGDQAVYTPPRSFGVQASLNF